MPLRGALRKVVHAVPALQQVVHRLRRVHQNAVITQEQRFYEKRTSTLPYALNDANAVFEEFQRRLLLRGIPWPPTEKPLHTMFATPEGNWELYSIPDELRELGRVSVYTPSKRGLNGTGASYRKSLSKDFVGFVRDVHRKIPVSFVLSYLSGSHLEPWAVEEIKELGIPVLGFHLDDRLVFRGRMDEGQWSGPAALCQNYDLNLTNSPRSLCKYVAEGGHAVFWPEGANPSVHHPTTDSKAIDVAFIGARYGERPDFMAALSKRGIEVQCFGPGWSRGTVSIEQMVQIFSTSRITLGTGRVKDSDDQCLKGRDFEVPMCGGLYLTSRNEDLPLVYRLGEEIETYTDIDECVEKIRMLLSHDTRADAIRQQGLKAARSRHRWMHRIVFLLEARAANFLDPIGDPVLSRWKSDSK